jgi:hypothetical protein
MFVRRPIFAIVRTRRLLKSRRNALALVNPTAQPWASGNHGVIYAFCKGGPAHTKR